MLNLIKLFRPKQEEYSTRKIGKSKFQVLYQEPVPKDFTKMMDRMQKLSAGNSCGGTVTYTNTHIQIIRKL